MHCLSSAPRLPACFKFRIRLVASVLALLTLASSPAMAQESCKFRKLGNLALKDTPDLVVNGSLNNVPVDFALGVGTNFSHISSALSDRLGLRQRHEDDIVVGSQGVRNLYSVHIKSLGLGPNQWSDVDLNVDEMDPHSPVQAMIGTDFLYGYDLEIWWANKVVNFFRPEHCDTAFLAYWDKGAGSVKLKGIADGNTPNRFVVNINGQAFPATLSNSVEHTTINVSVLNALKLPLPAGLEATGGKNAAAQDQYCSDRYRVTLDSIDIDDETIQHPRFSVCDLGRRALQDYNTASMAEMLASQPVVILGRDFIRTHRILIAVSQRRMYFSFLGGRVFADDVKTTEDEPATGRADLVDAGH